MARSGREGLAADTEGGRGRWGVRRWTPTAQRIPNSHAMRQHAGQQETLAPEKGPGCSKESREALNGKHLKKKKELQMEDSNQSPVTFTAHGGSTPRKGRGDQTGTAAAATRQSRRARGRRQLWASGVRPCVQCEEQEPGTRGLQHPDGGQGLRTHNTPKQKH